MMRSLPSALVLLIATLLALPGVQAQDVGGPYTVDDNTVLLMHFDGDVTNASDLAPDGVLSDSITGSTNDGNQDFFAVSGPSASFNQAIHFDNTFTGQDDCTDGPGICEYVAVPDHENLDLTGDWTIELWMNTGQSGGGFNTPAPVTKVVGPDDQNANYRFRLWTGNRRDGEATALYHTDDDSTEIAVTTAAGALTQGAWYHIAYIRDTSAGQVYVVVRDSALNVVELAAADMGAMPITTDDSLFIGVNPYHGGHHLDGQMDELRISNVVRSELVPTSVAFTDVTRHLINRPVDEATTISAGVSALGGTLSSVTLNYRVDGGTWESEVMTGDGTGTFTNEIPALNTIGAEAEYYLEAQLDNGDTFTDPEEATATDTYYSYTATPANSLVLDLDFEGGEGAPADASDLGHVVEVLGTPTYESDAAQGNYAMHFDGESSFLRIDPSPHLAAGEFTIDFWFKADAWDHNDRFVVKEGGAGVTNAPFLMNYQVFHAGSDGTLRGASLVENEGLNGGNLETPTTLNTGEWYRAIYQLTSDTAFVQFRNADNAVVTEAGYGSISNPATKTMGPFHVAHFTGNNGTFYQGAIDDLKVYNYAVELDPPVQEAPVAPTGLTASVGPIGVSLTWDTNTEPDLDEYRLYRGVSAGFDTTGAHLASIPSTDDTYLDVSAEAGGTYYYVLAAVDTEGNVSELSSEASVTMPGGGGDVVIGGPYESDPNTVLLMHFDGDFANASGATDDGTSEGSVSFEADTPRDGLGQSAYFDNSEETSLVSIADNDALDLTGDWTIETWAKTSFDPTTGPRLIMKPGDPLFHTNYYVAIEKRGGNHADRGLRTGYFATGNQFSADSLIQDARWYHYTYIRDTQREKLIQVIRDADGNLIWYDEFEYGDDPVATDQPLSIGGHPGVSNLRLTGYMDEVRISNIVREELVPQAATAMANVAAGETGVVLDTLGTHVTFADASGSDGELFTTRVGSQPQDNVFEGSATASGGASVTPEYIVGDKYWRFVNVGMSGFTYNMCLSADGVMANTNELLVVRRESPDRAWEALRTSQQDIGGTTYLCSNGLTALSEFALAGGEVQTGGADVLGGPYAADENTIVLMHFENDFANESDSTADATAVGGPTFQESVLPDLGQAIYLDNLDSESGDCRDEDSDCQYAFIPDTSALDMTGDWTMEAWVRVDDFANGFPRILHKVGDPVYMANWYLAPRSNGYVRGGYRKAGSGWHNNDTEQGIITEDAWYHITYIRDTAREQTLILVHDQDRNLLTYSTERITDEPNTTDEPLFIGVNPANNSHRLIGNMDEVRISNVVREYQGVSIAFIDNVTVLDSQQPDVPEYTVNADVDLYGTGQLDAVLFYSTGDDWEQVSMTPTQGTTFTADIPQQEAGSTVEYYVEAQVDGATKATSTTRNFQVLLPSDDVLALHFDDGAVPPTDSSEYAAEHTIDVVGTASYSGDAAEGDSSFVLDGSTYIEITDSDPLVVERATVDLWFNADEVPADSTRLLVKQGEDDWTQTNYEVWFDDGGVLRAGSILQGTDRDLSSSLVLDTAITAGQWYRAVYMVTGDAASLQLFDAEGALVDHAVATHGSTPKLASGALRIGHADGEDEPFFAGKVDHVVVSNYPAVPGPFVIDEVKQLVNQPSTLDDYLIYADVAHAGGGELAPRLHYRGKFGWAFIEMEATDDGLYEGNITSQPAGTVVPYFVSASAADGLYEATAPENANQDSTHYTFGVFEPGTQVLDLDFEEGQGVPMDASMYAEHNVPELIVVGENGTEPTYVEDAMSGSYAMRFDEADSSYLEIESSFLATEEFTLDFWFKPEEVEHGDRIVIKEGPGLEEGCCWWTPNYQVFMHRGTIRGASYIQDSGLNGGPLDLPNDTLEAGKWYHAIYELTADTAFVQLRDSADNVIQEIGAPQDGPAIKSVGPFRIGHSNGDDHSYYTGLVDRVRVFNYPVTGTPATLANVTELPRTVDAEDAPFVVTAEASKAAGALDVTLHYRVNGGDWQTIAMENTGGDTFSGEIPQQPLGARVEYYVEATDDFGNTVRMPEDDTRTFFVGQSETLALHLAFEEGDGQQVDSSAFDHQIQMINEPIYTTDTPLGDYAMQFAEGDSSYLEIADAPFLASEEFTLDFFMRADQLIGGTRVIAKEGGHGMTSQWWRPNYQILIPNDEGEIRGASYICNDEGDCGLNGGDSRVEGVIIPGVWYRVMYQAKQDSTIFQVRDAANNLLGEARVASDGAPVPTMGPFRIGHAGDVDNEYFVGAVDNVRFYNYAGDLEEVITDTEEEALPTEFALRQNYPNPFNPSTNIEFDLPKHSKVRLDVFNVLGRKVATLVDDEMPAGKHKVTFEASHVASGVYFYRIEAGDQAQVRKMVLVK